MSHPAHTHLRQRRIGHAAGVAALFLLLHAAAAVAQNQTAEEWCSARDVGRSQHCEVRQTRFTLSGDELAIDVGANGSIQVEGYHGSEVRVTARLTARARSESAARELAGRVEVRTAGGEVRATGPRTSGQDGWTVSVRVQVPAGTAVSARTTNGAVTIAATHAPVQVRTTNGSISVADVARRIDVRTTNGRVTAAFAPASQPLESAQLRTTNGAVHVTLPPGTSARLELSTTNGGITTDMPIAVQGRMNRRQVSAILGNGGPEIRVATTNGAIRISEH